MNKTISITLDGQLFHVEEPAYQSLDRYLQAVRAHFSTYPDRDEIVSDIESRIAEQFNVKAQGRNHVLSQADIDEVIKNMGTVEDFKEFGESNSESANAEPSKAKRKLYRDPDNKILGGVASGLAAYFGGIDPTIVRLIFILTLFAGGTGIVIYLVLWLIVPEANTPSEKMAMRGEPLTIASLEKKFRETVKNADEQVKKNENLKKAARAPIDFAAKIVQVFGQIAGNLLRVMLKVGGFFLSAGAVIALFASTFAIVALYVNIDSPYIDFPWQTIMAKPVFYILSTSAFLAVAVPLLFILLAGASLLSSQNKFRTTVVAGLAAVWFAALLTGGATALRFGPQYAETWSQQRETLLATEERSFDLSGFDRIEVTDGHRMVVRQGETFSIKAKGDVQAVERLQLSVQDGTLHTEQQRNNWRFCLFCVRQGTEIEVTMPTLADLSATNGSRVELSGFTADSIALHVLNASRVEANADIKQWQIELKNASLLTHSGAAENVTASVSNSSRLEMMGQHKAIALELSNASRAVLSGLSESLLADVFNGSRLEAQDLRSQSVKVVLDGYSRGEVHADAMLEATLSEGSRLEYVDTGVVPVADVSDSSRIEKRATAIK